MEKTADELSQLSQKIKQANLPSDLAQKVLTRLNQLSSLKDSATYLPEFDRINRYVDWIVSLPWEGKTDDILDLQRARQILDRNHYGLEEVKVRILEYISVMKLKHERGEFQEVMRAPILFFVGLVGTGKTTIAFSIAEALGRKVARIPFGGMGSPLDLRGQSRLHAEAEPGAVIKALANMQSRNGVILLDEIDRVAVEGHSSIMGVLVELLDPEQNKAFLDHYIDYPFDLSQTLFIATANNTTNIATAVMDRLEPLSMPSYTDQQKIAIGKDYLLPRAMREAGLPEGSVTFSEDVWPALVRPLGFDAGIRTLKRNIEGVIRKVARMLVEGKTQKVEITSANAKDFLPN